MYTPWRGGGHSASMQEKGAGVSDRDRIAWLAVDTSSKWNSECVWVDGVVMGC